jgi:hypothetical protein
VAKGWSGKQEKLRKTKEQQPKKDKRDNEMKKRKLGREE